MALVCSNNYLADMLGDFILKQCGWLTKKGIALIIKDSFLPLKRILQMLNHGYEQTMYQISENHQHYQESKDLYIAEDTLLLIPSRKFVRKVLY